MLSLEAMGIGAGDEVICPSFTFYATSEAIARAGATPVFADIDPVTLNLDPADVAARITPRTKAIMPVHLFGRPAPLAELAALGLPLIEDAAQAFGATGVASAGVCSTFSFFPTKNLFALGDGGLDRLPATTRSPSGCGCSASTARATSRRSSSSAPTRGSTRSRPPRCGSSSRTSQGWNDGRREGAARYAELGLGDAVDLPLDEPGHVYHMYVVRTPERAAISAALDDAGIASASYYVTPLHLQPAMRYLGYGPGSFPETERAAAENLALPLWGTIGADVQEQVVAAVLAAAGNGARTGTGDSVLAPLP